MSSLHSIDNLSSQELSEYHRKYTNRALASLGAIAIGITDLVTATNPAIQDRFGFLLEHEFRFQQLGGYTVLAGTLALAFSFVHRQSASYILEERISQADQNEQQEAERNRLAQELDQARADAARKGFDLAIEASETNRLAEQRLTAQRLQVAENIGWREGFEEGSQQTLSEISQAQDELQ